MLEEILSAVEQGLDKLPEREKIGAKQEVKNKANIDKEAKQQQDSFLIK